MSERHIGSISRVGRLFILVLLIAGCAYSPSDGDGIEVGVTYDIEEDPRAFETAAPDAVKVTVLGPEEALRQDAGRYAEEMGVTIDEALRRFAVMDEVGTLNAALQAGERETYGGLWLEHDPDFRVVVLFTRRGARTIRPYIRDVAWADLVEVRQVAISLAELEVIYGQVARELERLPFQVNHALDVRGNRIEVWVTDRAWFESELDRAGIRLPAQVELVVVEGGSTGEVDVCAPSAVPGVALPRQAPVEGIRATMEAEMIGELVLVDGCLRVQSIHSDTSYLPVWPAEYSLRGGEEGRIEVLDAEGEVVARAGDEVYVSGGEGSGTSMPDCVRAQLPASCGGPYWIVGDEVRPNLRRDSELFALEVIEGAERSAYLLRYKPALEGWAEDGASIAGQLVLYDRCPRVQLEAGQYVPLWPAEYEARLADLGNGAFEVVDGEGRVVARAGDEVRLSGGAIPPDWSSERYRRLQGELPGECYGPYWVVRQ